MRDSKFDCHQCAYQDTNYCEYCEKMPSHQMPSFWGFWKFVKGLFSKSKIINNTKTASLQNDVKYIAVELCCPHCGALLYTQMGEGQHEWICADCGQRFYSDCKIDLRVRT